MTPEAAASVLAVLASRAAWTQQLCQPGNAVAASAEQIGLAVLGAVQAAATGGHHGSDPAHWSRLWSSVLHLTWAAEDGADSAANGLAAVLWDEGGGLRRFLSMSPQGPAAQQLAAALDETAVASVSAAGLSAAQDPAPIALWAARAAEVLAATGTRAEAVTALLGAVASSSSAAAATFAWELACHVGLPAVLGPLDEEAAHERTVLLLAAAGVDLGAPLAPAAAAVSESLATDLIGAISSEDGEGSQDDSDDDEDEEEEAFGSRLVSHLSAGKGLSSADQDAVSRLLDRVFTGLLEVSLGDRQGQLGVTAAAALDALLALLRRLVESTGPGSQLLVAAVSRLFGRCVSDGTRARLAAAGGLEPLVASVSGLLRAAEDVGYRAYVSSLVQECIQDTPPLVLLAEGQPQQAQQALGRLRMVLSCIPTEPVRRGLLEGDAAGRPLGSLSEEELYALLDLTRRQINGRRSGRRALGLMGGGTGAAPAAMAAADVQAVSHELHGCISSLALLSLVACGDLPGAADVALLATDFAKEASGSVVVVLEELAEALAAEAKGILKAGGLHASGQGLMPL